MSHHARTDDLTCAQLVDLVTAYLDDALPEGESRLLDRHLEHCSGCSAYVEQIRAVLAVAGHVSPDDLCTNVKDELLRAFRGWRAGLA